MDRLFVMLRRFRSELQELRDAEPGTRFELGHERTRIENRVLRLTMLVVGIMMMLTAAITFWLPGPNFVLVFVGLVLVGGQSEKVAKLMDRGELAARRFRRNVWEPYPHKRVIRVLGAVLFASAGGLVAWVSYYLGVLPDWLQTPVDDLLGMIGR